MATESTSPEDAAPPDEVDQLLEPMVRTLLYAAINRKAATDADIRPHVVEHLRYMTDLERRGLLWASGPFLEPSSTVGDGLTVLRTDTLDEARALLEQEPLCARGLRTFEGPYPWELREGNISISLHASVSRFRLG